MLMLAVSTSGNIATAALIENGKPLHATVGERDKRHAQTLFPAIEQVFYETGRSLSEVELFGVDVGPGSFTGVRIGVSAVNAMAAAQGKLVVGVSALRGIYQPYASLPTPVCVLLDCGNGNGYAAQFCQGLELVTPEPVEVAPYRETLSPDTILITDVDKPADGPLTPEATWIGQAAYILRETATATVRPLYLRPSQAERMWKQLREAKGNGA